MQEGLGGRRLPKGGTGGAIPPKAEEGDHPQNSFSTPLRHVVGLSMKHTPFYEDIIQACLEECKSGAVKTRRAALSYVTEEMLKRSA